MTAPGVYEKRAQTVEAWQWDGGVETADLILDWIDANKGFAERHPYENLILLGDSTDAAKPTDWIVRDKFGDFWPIPAAIFPAVYKSLL